MTRNHAHTEQHDQVNAHGLAALAAGLKNLTELDVGGCERVDDSALRALRSMNAHFLNLSGCAAITETGVAGIAMNCTALSSLNVTGCPGIGRRFMAELCHSMKLSEPAQEYFGFQARLTILCSCVFLIQTIRLVPFSKSILRSRYNAATPLRLS